MRKRLEAMLRGMARKDKDLFGVVEQTLRLIGSGSAGLQHALTYLGSLPVASPLFGPKKVVPLIAVVEQQKDLLPYFDRAFFERIKARKGAQSQIAMFAPAAFFSGTAQNFLNELYREMLAEYYKQSWEYEYPRGVFKAWEVSMAVDGTNNEALRDYTRDFKIAGASGGTESEAAIRVDRLVAASAYPKKYHDVLASWLKNNGGQKIMTFLIEVAPHLSDQVSVLCKVKNKADWSIREGKLVLAFESSLGALMLGDRFLVARADGGIALMDQPEGDVGTLASVTGLIALNLNRQGHVEPQITSCKLKSHTSMLQSPVRIFDSSDHADKSNHTHGPK